MQKPHWVERTLTLRTTFLANAKNINVQEKQIASGNEEERRPRQSQIEKRRQ